MDIVITPEKLDNCSVNLGISVYDEILPGSATIDIFGNIVINPGVNDKIPFTIESVSFRILDKDNQPIKEGEINVVSPLSTSLTLNPEDGHTEYTITVNANNESVTSIYNVFNTCGIDECYNRLSDKYKYACGNDDDLLKYLKIKTIKEVIEELLSEGKINQATCIWNGGEALCETDENCVKC